MSARATPVSLREHLEAQIASLDQRMEQRIKGTELVSSISLAAANAAITKAETATDRRFDNVNEFRGALNDMVGRMMPRAESEANWHGCGEKLGLLSDRLTRIEGTGTGVKALWGVLAGLIGLGIAATSLVIALLR